MILSKTPSMRTSSASPQSADSLGLGRMFGTALLSLAFVGCAMGPCRQVRNPEMAAQQQSPARPLADPTSGGAPIDAAITREAASSSSARKAKPSVGKEGKEATVFVFKPDGSKQCEENTGVAPEAMEKKDLGGIKVLSRDKRNDGMMHVQVCGRATGQVNVYEIPAGMLKEVETRGFKKFEKSP